MSKRGTTRPPARVAGNQRSGLRTTAKPDLATTPRRKSGGGQEGRSGTSRAIDAGEQPRSRQVARSSVVGEPTSAEPASKAQTAVAGARAHGWTFLTNHAHVLFCLAEDGEIRMRDLAARVGITERAVARIVDELEEAGYLTRDRQGRRNHYAVHGAERLRHPIEAHCTVDDLVRLVLRRR